MRLSLGSPYIDGPSDLVSATRCASQTMIGPSLAYPVDLNDAQSQAFFSLEDELRSAVFAAPWAAVPSPPPSPRP